MKNSALAGNETQSVYDKYKIIWETSKLFEIKHEAIRLDNDVRFFSFRELYGCMEW